VTDVTDMGITLGEMQITISFRWRTYGGLVGQGAPNFS
jgi:hypothetical protein